MTLTHKTDRPAVEDSVFASDKAVFQLVHRDADFALEQAREALRKEGQREPYCGFVHCPQGCGTRIYWALAAGLADYKEQFLIYLNQQISWTVCPDHTRSQPRHVLILEKERDWTYLPPAAAILGGTARVYNNCYE